MIGVKLLGHSVHPMLIVFPLGLMATAVVFDFVQMCVNGGLFAAVSYWLLVGGLIGGALAAVFGFIDWTYIPRGTRAKSIGLIHGLVNAVALVLFAISLYVRHGDGYSTPGTAVVFSAAGAGIALAGGWLGGELVERLGVGVHEGANVNAPSSLTVSEVRNK
jgi:uncharacterized membrane protein